MRCQNPKCNAEYNPEVWDDCPECGSFPDLFDSDTSEPLGDDPDGLLWDSTQEVF